MRPETAPEDLFNAAATDGMDRPAARISINRRSSSSVQDLFCCSGTISSPDVSHRNWNFISYFSIVLFPPLASFDLQMRARVITISDHRHHLYHLLTRIF
jgi:hypothetical protein